MKKKTNQSSEDKNTTPTGTPTKRQTSRRSLLRAGLAVGGASAVGAGLFNVGVLNPARALARDLNAGPTRGDLAILQFLAALEIIETDLWEQYNELGGIQDSEVPGGSGNSAYINDLLILDGDMRQYIHDNTDDEHSHFTFINAYLESKGVRAVNLDRFRTLAGSQASGSSKKKRITNLLELTIDTSFWTRYRSDTQNPDLGDTLPQAVPGLNKGRFKAIPADDADTQNADHIKAIAFTAGFHFAFIEQGGSSLYPSLAQRVTNAEVLRILLSIGPTETMHFQTWQDKAGNATPVTDPITGLTFQDLTATTNPLLQANLIMPEPTFFLSRKFPKVSIIRPTDTHGAAKGAVEGLKADGLFRGQSDAFFDLLDELAEAADYATRQF
jgi:hypothetical protein